MSQLIILRQRIKVVETIKKTTNAMRLISMSGHTRLKQQLSELHSYQQELDRLYAVVSHQVSQKRALPRARTNEELFIFVGSQKGLCGSFNTSLAAHYKTFIAEKKPAGSIVIGKQLVDLFTLHQYPITQAYPTFGAANFAQLAETLCTLIHGYHYAKITVVSTVPKTFFIHRIEETVVYPFQEISNVPHSTSLAPVDAKGYSREEYLWEQPAPEMLEYLAAQACNTKLARLLFNSLLAEQAARFISMDSSTHNAENLLADMRLQYNKLRQAAITRELTDLTSSMSAT